MRSAGRRLGFTLIELLTVIAIIAVLAAILFPVFAAARGKAREITCSSDLRQIGMSLRMYTQDYDELYPYAVDPTDRVTPEIWSVWPDFQAQIPTMPYLHEALQPYIRSAAIFHCPADTGYEVEDFTGMPIPAQYLPMGSSFEKFGTSFNYRTEISFRHMGEASFQRPAEVNVLMDGAGKWHGGLLFNTRRYNTLFADTHVKNLSWDQEQAIWNQPL